MKTFLSACKVFKLVDALDEKLELKLSSIDVRPANDFNNSSQLLDKLLNSLKVVLRGLSTALHK